jgi:AsmA protein
VKKFFRFLGIGAAVLVALAIVLVILAKVLITPERIRQTILPIARESLHRDVSLGDIEVNIFSGIEVKNLVVQGREGNEPFVSADEVVLRYRFWPLLLGHVVVDEVRLDHPHLQVERLKDGSFNYSDLLEQKEPAGAGTETAAPKPGGRPIDLLVSKVSIKNGEMVFLDHTIGGSAPFRYLLTGLDLSASDISLTRAFPFMVMVRFNDSVIDLQGEADPSSGKADLKAVVKGLDVMAFAPYFQDKIPGKLGSLMVSLDLAASGGPDSLTSKGKIALKNVNLVLQGMEKSPIKDATLTLDYDVKADRKSSRLEIEEATLAYDDIPVKISGTIEHFAAEPVGDLTIGLSKLDLRSLVKAVPAEMVKSLTGLDLAGTLDARLHLAGPFKEPKKLIQDGEVELGSLQANAGGFRPALSGNLEISGDSLQSKNLVLKLGDNQAEMDIKIAHFWSRPIQVVSRISSDRFALDPLLKSSAAPAAPAAAGEEMKPSEGKSTEMGPIDLPITLDGSIKVKETLYKGLTINDFDLNCRLEKNIFTLDRMTGKITGGTFNQTARVDLAKKGFVYNGQSMLKGISADPLITAFFPSAAGTVFGTLNLNGDFNGRGTTAENLKKNLSGKGDFLLTDGKVTGAGLVQGFADYLNLEQLRVLKFSQAKGNFRIQDGRVLVNSTFNGPDLRMAPAGSFGLDGSLDIALNASLGPSLVGKISVGGSAAQFLTDKEGWAQLPIKVAGTVKAPKFALDTSAVGQKIKEQAGEEIRKKLEEKLFKKKAPPEGEQPGAQPTPGKSLEDAVKGLFGN